MRYCTATKKNMEPVSPQTKVFDISKPNTRVSTILNAFTGGLNISVSRLYTSPASFVNVERIESGNPSHDLTIRSPIFLPS